jgi:hypothetical protein
MSFVGVAEAYSDNCFSSLTNAERLYLLDDDGDQTSAYIEIDDDFTYRELCPVEVSLEGDTYACAEPAGPEGSFSAAVQYVRYASVARLDEDLERFLQWRPITARPRTVAYRARKFGARNRVAVAGSTLALVLITGMAGVFTARLADERDRAQLEADKAQQISEFLQSLFEVADPATAAPGDMTAHELLGVGARRIQSHPPPPRSTPSSSITLRPLWRRPPSPTRWATASQRGSSETSGPISVVASWPMGSPAPGATSAATSA